MTLQRAAEIAKKHNSALYTIEEEVFNTDNYDLALKVAALTGFYLEENILSDKYRYSVYDDTLPF